MTQSKQDQKVEQGGEPAQPKVGDLKEADKVAGPYIEDAEADDAPVRTNRPDVPIVTTLKVGAGEHKPNTDPNIGPDGRFDPELAEG